MKGSESLTDKYEPAIAPLREAMLIELDAYWQSGMERRTDEFINAFRGFCERIAEQQAQGMKAPIAYIHVSYLRSWLLQEKLIYSLEAYDDRWFIDRAECIDLLEMPWLLPFIERITEELAAVKPFNQAVPDRVLEAVLLQELKVLHQYVREWLRKAVPLVIALPEFQAIDRAEVLRICTGEYKDFSETVWVDDRRPKDADELKRWLEQRLPTAYMCSDLRGLNLSGGRYEGIDLRSSHCAGSNWSDSSLHSSICISTDFSQCQMSGTDFSQSLLHDANFSGSDLRGAQFKEAVGTKRFIHEGMVLGFSGVNFTGANLQGASLLYADFHGACFEGANLSGAMLMKQVMNKWKLSEEQKQSVIWMEEDESGVPVQASGNKGSKT